jgi:hypothetical protein
LVIRWLNYNAEMLLFQAKIGKLINKKRPTF